MKVDDETQAIMESNVDITLSNKYGTFRRESRTIFSYENSWMSEYYRPSFGYSLYNSLLNGFSDLIKWDGLPPELNSYDIERFIVGAGVVKFIKVGTEYKVVRITPEKYNHYGEVIKSWITEPFLGKLNGKRTEKFKSVELINNPMRTSLIRMVFPYIEIYDDTLFNLDIHMKLLTGSLVWFLDESQKTGENQEENTINNWMLDGKPVKVVMERLDSADGDKFKVIQFESRVSDFIEGIRFTMNQMLNVLGIPNDNAEDKKERKVVAEVSIQNILQSTIISSMLEVRKRAVEKINETFGLNISVRLNDALVDQEEPEKELENESE